jgi:hypothetical protein
MFKVIITDVETLLGKHYTTRRVAFGKSPKQAWAKLRRYNGEHTVSGGCPEGYGGTPVLQGRRLEKNGKVLSEIWD